MNMKKIIIAIVIILVAVSLLSVWDKEENQIAKIEPIKVGVILPLSGAQAKVGEDIRAALEIAKADDKDGLIELIYEDDGFTSERAVSAFNKLIAADGVRAIIGPLNSSGIEAVKPLALQNQVVAFTPWGAANKISGYVIKGSHEAESEAKILAELIVTKLNKKSPAIIYMNNDFGLLHHRAFKEDVESRGGTLVAAEPFVVGSTDFRTSLLKIKNANPDALYIVYNGAGVGKISKQARELGIKVPLFGQYATEASDLMDDGGESLEGLVYTFPINEGSLTFKQKEFINKFEETTGGRPQVAAYNAYDIYQILADTFASCGATNASCVKDQILNLKNYSGVSGNISFNLNSIQRQFYFKTIRNGQFVRLEQ
jgi:branched-chain amino acid transport system substrate-binding protein